MKESVEIEDVVNHSTDVGVCLTKIVSSYMRDEESMKKVMGTLKEGRPVTLSLIFNGVEIPCMEVLEKLFQIRDEEVLMAAERLLLEEADELSDRIQSTTAEFLLGFLERHKAPTSKVE